MYIFLKRLIIKRLRSIIIVRILKQMEILGVHFIEFAQLLCANQFHRWFPQRRRRFGFRLHVKKSNPLTLVQFVP
jgi:hypothetical protein